MYGIPRRTSRFPVQVIALHKDRMVAQASHPDIAFAPALELHTFPNV